MAKQPAKISKRELRRKKVRRRRRIFGLTVLALFLGLLFGIYQLFLASPVRSQVSWEAGSGTPAIAVFLKEENPNATMLTHMGNLDLKVPGDYPVEIQIGTKTYVSTLRIIDTIPPEGTPVNQQAVVNTQIDAESFVTNIQDATEVTVTYETQPDFSLEGTQEIAVVMEDAGGNRTRLSARLTLTRDTTPPVIEGAVDLQVAVGRTVSFGEGVTASDNYDLTVKVEVDDSQVDLTQPGTYPLVYSACDHAGNGTSVTVTVTVTEDTGEPEIESEAEDDEPEAEREEEDEET